MEVPATQPGLPEIHRNHTVCPFCGDVCHETVDGASSSFARASVHTSIGFHCMSGCSWELHIVSEEGNLEAHCVLMGIHEELREQRSSQTIASCLRA
jgi:hypothetical protein